MVVYQLEELLGDIRSHVSAVGRVEPYYVALSLSLMCIVSIVLFMVSGARFICQVCVEVTSF